MTMGSNTDAFGSMNARRNRRRISDAYNAVMDSPATFFASVAILSAALLVFCYAVFWLIPKAKAEYEATRAAMVCHMPGC